MIGRKKILLTGASGYIGSRLCKFLSLQGHELIGLFHSPPVNKDNWTSLVSEIIVGDIRNDKTIKLISKHKPQIIIHLVSLDHIESEKNSNESFSTNVQPIWNLLNDSTKNNNKLEKFINFSSVQVYGKKNSENIDENQKVKPVNNYGLTHYLREEICNYYNNSTNINCINLRLSNSYGNPVFLDAKCWKLVVNDLAKTAYEQKKIILNSDGNTIRDFIHFSDICHSIDKLITTNKVPQSNTINLCSSKSVSLITLAKLIQDIYLNKYSVQIPIYINKNELFSEEKENIITSSYKVSNNVLCEDIYTPIKSLKEGINDIFDYFEKNQLNKSINF
jgi:UDP-glucose 4-epimerase